MSITLSQAKEKLEKYGQPHVLKYFEELSETEKAALLAQIETSDMNVIDSCRHQEELLQRGVITPLAAMQLPEIQANRESFTATGLEAIRAGRVGVYTMWASPGNSISSSA